MANLTINFIPPSPPCVNGFKVKYRRVGDTVYTTVTPNPMTSPVVISVPDGNTYEGTIQSDCSNSIFSPVFTFRVAPCVGEQYKIVKGVCEKGNKSYVSSTLNSDGVTYTCVYSILWSDGSRLARGTEQSPTPCI